MHQDKVTTYGKGWIGRNARQLARAWKVWRRERCDADKLMHMDARLLADVGLDREGAEALADQVSFLSVFRRVRREPGRDQPGHCGGRSTPACPCSGS